MTRILIVQTTRMGDVLQTTPLIHMVRQKYPKAHITLMVRRMGRAIAERNPDIDDVMTYDEDELYRRILAEDADQLLEAYQITDARIQALRTGNFDIAYNVTHSVASAMLLKIAGIPRVYGAHLGDDWQFILRGNWTTYFFTSVFSREYNDLNLCDITRNVVDDAPPCRELIFNLKDEDIAFAETLRQEHGIGPDDYVACFQLGASQADKRWSIANFAALGRLLVEQHHAKVFLLGVESEQPLGDEFERHAPGLATHLFGKTSVAQVAALLKDATILVTNDTGTMHIAASVKCPIVLVSVGNVHYRETGPYGEGHCAMEARRTNLGRSDFVPTECDERELIKAEQVLAAIRYAREHGHKEVLPPLEGADALDNVDLYITRFAPDGFLEYYPVLQRAMDERDFLRIAYRAMWIAHLSRVDSPAGEIDSLDQLLRHYVGPEHATVSSWAADSAHHFRELAAISERGMTTTDDLLKALRKRGAVEEAKALVARLMALDEEARVFSEVNPPCRPLILMARFERDNLDGADPMNLAMTTLDIYRACRTRCLLMVDKLELVAACWTARA